MLSSFILISLKLKKKIVYVNYLFENMLKDIVSVISKIREMVRKIITKIGCQYNLPYCSSSIYPIVNEISNHMCMECDEVLG